MGFDGTGGAGVVQVAGSHMKNSLINKSDSELRDLLQASRQTLAALVERLTHGSDRIGTHRARF